MNSNDHIEKHNKFISTLKDIVLDNFTNEQFGASDLVKQYGISRSQLLRKLKTTTGQSVSQFIREIRLEESLKLLQNEDITASEVAYKVGFNSPTYFNTCFHEYFGYPPGEAKHHIGEPRVGEAGILNRGLTKRSFLRRNKTVVLAVAVLISFSLAYLFYFKPLGDKEIVANKLLSKENSIAVLPLKNWSGDVELEYISDGMTDAIISRLARIKSLTKVVPFTSILSYKDTNKSISTIANELDVNNLLQGSFQLSGGQVKISLQLLDSQSENQLWSHDYSGDWQGDDIFEIQAEVAKNVATIMNAEISESEYEQLLINPTDNREAYNYFLLAVYQHIESTKSAFDNAIILYEKAIALDTNFVEAHTGLADIWITGGAVWGAFDEHEAWANAKEHLQKALTIDSNSVEINYTLNIGLFYYDWDFTSVEHYYQNEFLDSEIQGLAIGSDYAVKTGRYDNAMQILNQDVDLMSSASLSFLYCTKAQAFYFMGNNEESILLLKSSDPLFNSQMFYLRESAKLYYYLGEFERSKRQLSKLMDGYTDRPPIVIWLNAIHAKINGENTRAESFVDDLNSMYINEQSGSPAWFMALYYCHVKNYDKAFYWLEKSYDRHEVEMTWLKEEPLLRPLRTDPRYIDLYDKVGFSKIVPITPYVE